VRPTGFAFSGESREDGTVSLTADSPHVIVVGAGGFGREVADVVRDAGRRLGGYVDDGDPDVTLLERRGEGLLGPIAHIESWTGEYLIGIGSPVVRRAIDAQATSAGVDAASVVHPSAFLGADTEAEPGLVVCANASITTNVRFGRHCHVNLNATVGHDCRIGDYVTINPGANISGGVTLADDVTVGTGAAIIQGVTVGEGTTIGAGAVVVRDLPPGVTAVGIPARPLAR
jgi:sugar O-acyltransferase (sialic acid O-acetyltransferase NeuD family)